MSHPLLGVLREAEGWNHDTEAWVSVSEGLHENTAEIFVGDENDDIGERYFVIFFEECTHEREGIVTNQPEFPPTFERPFSSMSTCGSRKCIEGAQGWIAATTNEPGVWVPDERTS